MTLQCSESFTTVKNFGMLIVRQNLSNQLLILVFCKVFYDVGSALDPEPEAKIIIRLHKLVKVCVKVTAKKRININKE